MIPRSPGYVSVGSRRYNEWQTLAYEATVEREAEEIETYAGPLVDHPEYTRPTQTFTRSEEEAEDAKDPGEIEARSGSSCDDGRDRRSTKETCAVKSVCQTPGRSSEEVECKTTDSLQGTAIHQSDGIEAKYSEIQDRELPDQSDRLAQGADIVSDGGDAKEEEPRVPPGYYHEGGESFAEDIEQHLDVLPEVATSSTEITINDGQVGDSGVLLTEVQERLRQLIWNYKHLLIGKGNALPPAARGAVCGIDVGGANPIAQRVRPVAPKFQEKLADLIKGLLSAKIIRPSISPWASPIVVIINKNCEDIMLYID